MNLNPVTVGVNNIEPASKIGVKPAEYTYTSHIGNTPTPELAGHCIPHRVCPMVLVFWCLYCGACPMSCGACVWCLRSSLIGSLDNVQ